MKKWIILLTLSIHITFTSCCQNQDMSKIKILPLHPYSSSPTDYDSTATKSKNFVVKFYFIEGACKSTDELSERVDMFITESLKKDNSDFMEYGGYYIYFYQETNHINKDFKESIDGMISSDILDEYSDDLLFRYEWSDKKFVACDYYKNGKVVNTLYRKKGVIFKPNLPAP